MYTQPFHSHYGVTYSEARGFIEGGASEEIIQTLNTRVHVQVMEKWQAPGKLSDRVAIEKIADYLVKAYQSSPEAERKGLFSVGSVPRTKFKQMVDLFEK